MGGIELQLLCGVRIELAVSLPYPGNYLDSNLKILNLYSHLWLELSQSIKIDLDKNLDQKQKTIQAYNIDANFLSKSILMCGVCFITFCFSDRHWLTLYAAYEEYIG